MALYFTKKKRWPPSKPIQYILAVFLLLLAITILSSWLVIRYHRSAPTLQKEPETTTTTQVEKATEIGHALIILDLDKTNHFVLVQTNPNTNLISVVSIPTNLADEDGCLLSEALHHHGASALTASVAKALDLPVSHYVSFSSNGIEQFVNQLDNGVLFTLPERITFTDENGASIRLSAGEHRLSASQVRSVLEYTNWKKVKNRENVAANLIKAVINQYLVKERSLDGYFANLSNASTTDLRIDNFNHYYTALEQLSTHNDGKLCRRVELKGTTKKGIFIPDLEAFRRESNLYS